MAGYKVIQDIEAEDKLVGPLTLRQFIFAIIAAFCAYLSFIALTKGFTVALFILVPPMLFTGFFAFPWGRDQPTEVWALAKIRYFLKSRKRIWNQSGIRDLVTITAPKRVEKRYTNGLSAYEVQSRLSALANTLDSRGWAVKNVYTVPAPIGNAPTDRLVDIGSLPRAVPSVVVPDTEDMLDEINNPRAHQLGEMVAASTKNRKEQLLEQMRLGNVQATPAPATPPAASSLWFARKPLDIPQPPASPVSQPAAPVNSLPAGLSEEELTNELHKRHAMASVALGTENLKTIEPLGQTPATPPQPAPPVPPAPVTPVPDPATINLANNDDLNIATIARIANKKDTDSGEVVISLHSHD